VATQTLLDEIQALKKEKDAYILAHVYQIPEIQDLADLTGDSLALSRQIEKIPNRLIVFCGVRFMAETAKILSPDKTVLLPSLDAGCPLADMVSAQDIRKIKALYPDAAVVCYINSSAAVKAESDICCTSSNAVDIVRSLPQKRIIFVPDQHLGTYVAEQVPEKEILCWHGYCPVHHQITANMMEHAHRDYPKAKLAAHPECPKEVVDQCDFVGSTKQIIDHIRNSKDKEFVIITEEGIMHSLKKQNPGKTLHLLTPALLCEDMKRITLPALRLSLKNEQYAITVPEETAQHARRAIENMLHV
jgi:quinolinate synthase